MKLFQNDTINRKLILKEKLRNTRQNKGEGVVSYITRIKLVKDELEVVEEKIDEDELMRTTLNGFPKQWNVFVQVINGR